MQKNLSRTLIENDPSAVLILENGEIFWGKGMGAEKANIGELCFNTSQSGYQEILTDPSYAKQIITFTFPHVGIVGSNEIDIESNKIFASGCVLNQFVRHDSSWRSQFDLNFFLKKNDIPCITGLDTRLITRKLAKKGALKAAVINFGKNKFDLDEIIKDIKNWKGLKNLDLASLVSTKNNYKSNQSIWNLKNNNYTLNNKKDFKIACLDFGIKNNILRELNNNLFSIEVLPALSSFEEIINTNPDGIFLSNGPGDPYATGNLVIPVLKKLFEKKMPIFGICLGHQLLSLALGAQTRKMFQGHRGANHPVKNLKTSEVEITSQNHGFEVDRNSLPDYLEETHISLFDGSNEGISHKSLPFFSVQYHPEASPGPHDSHYLFDEFRDILKRNA